jgi:hypothetical protein
MKDILKIAFIVMLLGFNTALFAQTDGRERGYEEVDDEEDPFEESWKDKLVFGGSIFPGYSNGWILEMTPMIGYKITNSTVAGVGINYSYRSFNDPYGRYSFTNRIYGGRAFVMQDLAYGAFAQIEADYNYLTYKEKDAFDNLVVDQRFQSPGFLVGGGYRQRGDRVSYNITLLYDVLNRGNGVINRPNSIGPGLILRGGVIFNL